MKIIQISDLHGDLKYLEKAKDYLKNADLIIISGDITNFGKKEKAKEIIEIISNLNKNIFAITGNCDYNEVQSYLDDININLHDKHKSYGNYNFWGFSGSLPCPSITPNIYEEKDLKKSLNILSEKKLANLILISHNPPYNTKVDAVNPTLHVGSKELRNFIEKNNPMLCLSGHIHEAYAIDKINNTILINPGPFMEGKLCQIEISDDIKVELINLK